MILNKGIIATLILFLLLSLSACSKKTDDLDGVYGLSQTVTEVDEKVPEEEIIEEVIEQEVIEEK